MKLKPRFNGTAALVLAAGTLACMVRAQSPEDQKLWEAQHAKALAEARVLADRLQQQRDARKADPMAWVRTLDPMATGGWEFRAVASDGSWAAYSTDHQMKRSGHLITVWMRQEYPEAQRGGGTTYLSDVEQVQYDCGKNKVRALNVVYFGENNITGTQQSEENDPKLAPWEPIVPGTQGESIFQWACASKRGS